MGKLLEIENLSTAYFVGTSKEKIIHSSINASLDSGELSCILGLNGTGKSTLIRSILGMQKTSEGKVSIGGKDASKINIKQFSKLISVVLTDKIDDSFLRIYDLIATGRYPHGSYSGKLNRTDLEIIDKAFITINIVHLRERIFSQLSDGEKQRVLIARAIAQDTPLIILDEPAAFIDSPGKIGIMELLKDLADNHNKAILMATHDIESALRYANNLWILGKQGSFEKGIPDDMIKQGIINKYFDNEEIVFNTYDCRFEKKH